MARKDTLWELKPHTAAKHSILKRHLEAFYPKLSSVHGRVVIIDGFAGPGEYAGGEPGSPIIALDALEQHRHSMGDCQFVFLFVEARRDRADHLKRLVERRALPPNVRVTVQCAAFEDKMTEVLDSLEDTLAPSFVMIDPFGVKGLPMDLVRRLSAHSRVDILISFMYESISRWMNTPEFREHLDAMFGTDRWREAAALGPDAKRIFLHDLYVEALRTTGFDYVRSFELRDAGNRTEYYLMFGTHSLAGLKAIKYAMWRADEEGGAQFSDATDQSQLTLLQANPDSSQLRRLICSRFGGGSQASVEEIEEFVLVETAFRETHFRRQVLAPLEKEDLLTVVRSLRKKSGSYPPGTVVKLNG